MRLATSPYATRQEEYRDDPWKMLMVCFMLNQTSHKQVDKVRHEFFSRYPNAQAFLDSVDSEVIELIKPLGFYNRRVKAWKEFCRQWIAAGTDAPSLAQLIEMKGVGKYALDSWKVFQLYEYDTDVQDHVLNWYVEWAKEEVERIKRDGKEYTSHVVYYIHYYDERHMDPAWMSHGDYAACVMARTAGEAIEKVKTMVEKGDTQIKVMGIATGPVDWVNEESPIFTDEEAYRKRKNEIIKMINSPHVNSFNR
jgi:endonuclease III-like uncharacterized protein